MDEVLKFILFSVFVISFAIAGYYVYKFLNKRIIGSKTGWELLAYSLSLIAINVVLFFGGLTLFFKLYFFLTK